ncbi:hypothetical protein D8674_040611 [Pyrus ussuriensis x Pyrus communis]|uniref:Uncharacterized protein n=1 Tax=Pyrus ussuriensis x Pyrus communis TaxID=2448454 RepID=A0A5N5H588_9ROSA|nr:hypothetical protein D8674_014173 [Pyrus ussuriensis x Pyrus communis]KAB2620653.1 hypothetical protein D8674_040611 [Pyrus ussuriensis x Pyrus communis]
MTDVWVGDENMEGLSLRKMGCKTGRRCEKKAKNKRRNPSRQLLNGKSKTGKRVRKLSNFSHKGGKNPPQTVQNSHRQKKYIYI